MPVHAQGTETSRLDSQLGSELGGAPASTPGTKRHFSSGGRKLEAGLEYGVDSATGVQSRVQVLFRESGADADTGRDPQSASETGEARGRAGRVRTLRDGGVSGLVRAARGLGDSLCSQESGFGLEEGRHAQLLV